MRCRLRPAWTALFSLIVITCLTPETALAKMYKWKDAERNVHYTQTPPPKGAQAGKQLNVRTGSKVTPRKRGKDTYCGERRVPKVNRRAPVAIANLNSSQLNWQESIRRIRESKAKYIKSNAKQATTSRFNERLSGFDKQVAEYQCQVDWSKEQLVALEDDKAKILEHHGKLEALQADVEERKKATCGVDRRDGVIIVDDAYRAFKSCIRSFDRELRKLRKSIRKSKSDVKLISE